MSLTAISNPSEIPPPDPKDPEGFSALVRLHHADLLVYGRALTKDSATASDIVQESFIVAYDKIHTFDVTRDFPTWMRGIIRNKWREWLRKNRRYELSELDLAQIDADVAAWQEERLAGQNTLFIALEGCLDRLPKTLREAIDACYYEGCTSDEAAELLGATPGAIRKRLERARTLIKSCLDSKLENLSHQS